MNRFYQLLSGVQDVIVATSKKQPELQTKALCKLKTGDKVRNINQACMHYGSEGVVQMVEPIPDEVGYVISYLTTNDGKSWKPGEMIRKTEDQLTLLDVLPKTLVAEENETPEYELMEYKSDFLDMNIGSLTAIMRHASEILKSVEEGDASVKENLTESWLQGKIAITEDYMRTIHDFVKYVPSDDDNSFAGDKPGLWENIRKKKDREGKKYKPAKPGDPDRPDPKQWKRLQEENQKDNKK
jgi:hypothetical protein